ncbi:MAG: tRNA (guanosine(37)-N1)-methyltransferase TrmD [Eubacterium sp.]|nr:tRNA (guanosine(37)-N1)-methyltransferase TrmD [Eubacterium sp.]
MKYYVMTLFPEMFETVMTGSIMGRAVDAGHISYEIENIRDYTPDKHNRVDDYPYGGGAGMVMEAEPVYRCYEEVCSKAGHPVKVIHLTPQGKPFTQELAAKYAGETELAFLCGHYEGIDERVLEEIGTEDVSIGDYVLTGGELPAMVMMDAIARLVPGVLGNSDSSCEESFSDGLLEYPQYTRPEEILGRKVPEILLSGHHKNIEKWRLEQSIERTKTRRPDMFEKYESKK